MLLLCINTLKNIQEQLDPHRQREGTPAPRSSQQNNKRVYVKGIETAYSFDYCNLFIYSFKYEK